MNMSHITIIVSIILLSYTVGSIPVGLLVGKIFKNKDISTLGSQNIGSSNVTRVLGFKLGLLTFILDFLKGFLPIFIVECLTNNGNINPEIKAYRVFFGIAAVLGHMFSMFNKFKGGKAIASSVGFVTSINCLVGLLGIVSFVIMVRFSGYASLSSLIATALVNVGLWINTGVSILYHHNPNPPQNCMELCFIFITTIIIFLKHYKNIINLLEGKENKFNFKSKKTK
ncbi:glycerol-3-phosphate 1-O-acyltransferase PlsY [Candidatus Phytoplasma pruni]|uniref:Glycerol-3-phosphate acyltransferase n=1 Tax=Candidatus Phytoplasma pruni TaxID=479893 RepID=A0A851H9J2_9MOLU|nr:glycerol-3-phosphate 1-O-acyltransferase PlsY [Candidatus Phytoplasma pruni]NWN45537.1 glycerol-3-phosphate 1-O-acyltransferase PlsY [Candidatus Phytoplasma pruni]